MDNLVWDKCWEGSWESESMEKKDRITGNGKKKDEERGGKFFVQKVTGEKRPESEVGGKIHL